MFKKSLHQLYVAIFYGVEWYKVEICSTYEVAFEVLDEILREEVEKRGIQVDPGEKLVGNWEAITQGKECAYIAPKMLNIPRR